MLNKQPTSPEDGKTTGSSSTTSSTTTSAMSMSSMARSSDSRQQTCTHNVYIKGLCGNCGIRLDPPQSSSAVSMIHSVPELKVSEEYGKEIGKADQRRLIDDRKLVLLVDLDQTILHTTHEEVKNDPNVHSFKLWPGHPTYYTKLRPFLQEFLDQISQFYELHIFTFGCRLYAHKIASIIDPNQEYFGNRILSRDESVDQYSKKGNLNNLFPCGDAMVCIIDDRSDVWRNAENLIQVKAYSYFRTSISDGAMTRRTSSEEDDAELESDVDKLEALLALDDEPGDNSSQNDEHDEKDNDSENDDQNIKNNREDEEGHGKGEKTKQQSEESADELEEDSGRETKKLKEVHEVDVDAKEDSEEDQTDKRESNGDESKDSSENKDKKEAGEGDEGEESPNPSSSSSSSPKIEEDLDDYLLVLIGILRRIHEKWYKELDYQIEHLGENECYKLPAIKDIIRTYFRKR